MCFVIIHKLTIALESDHRPSIFNYHEGVGVDWQDLLCKFIHSMGIFNVALNCKIIFVIIARKCSEKIEKCCFFGLILLKKGEKCAYIYIWQCLHACRLPPGLKITPLICPKPSLNWWKLFKFVTDFCSKTKDFF